MNADLANRLPGLDCGLCGHPKCEEFAVRLLETPDLIKRCIRLDSSATPGATKNAASQPHDGARAPRGVVHLPIADPLSSDGERRFLDSLGREFDFVLEHFPEDPGPREIIVPHNPMLTRELEIKVGDVMIGRPLGMSCGCPVTHCGEVIEVDRRTGVITWCVTGPLKPRQQGFKDIGFYIAEAYEGLVQSTRLELRIGMRYFFQPDLCMLPWRHLGLVNYLNRTQTGWQVRLEGLWIG